MQLKKFKNLIFSHPNRSNDLLYKNSFQIYLYYILYYNIWFQVERNKNHEWRKSNFQECIFKDFIFKDSTKVELSLKREFPVYASGYSPSVSLPRSRFFFLPWWITRLSHGRDSQFVIFARWRNSDEKRVAPMDVRFPSDC